MFIDAHQRYSVAQAIASARSTNVLDHGVTGRHMGTGTPMAIVVAVTTLLDATTGDETYTVKLQTDDDEAFGSATDLTPAVNLPRGSAAGTKFVIPIPSGVSWERFSSLLYAVGGTTPLGNVTAWLTSMDAIQNEAVYADAITISI